MKPQQLAGIWRTDNHGGHSDNTLVFFPDGTGAIDYYNVVFAGRTEFHWSIVEPGQLRFEPALWIVGTVEAAILESDGEHHLRIEFEAAAPKTDQVHRATLDFFRSTLTLEDYSPPVESTD